MQLDDGIAHTFVSSVREEGSFIWSLFRTAWLGKKPYPLGIRKYGRYHRPMAWPRLFCLNGDCWFDEEIEMKPQVESLFATVFQGNCNLRCADPVYCWCPISRTILPGLCGAPASMYCAWRASESGRTEPTRAVILPASNIVVSVCRRAVVTSA